MKLYERIDRLLSERNDSRKKMCDDIGISYNTFNSMLKRQSSSVDVGTVLGIAKHFGITTDYLLGATDSPVKPERFTQTPEVNSLAERFAVLTLPLFESMGDDSIHFSETFSEYILSEVQEALSKCKTYYDQRETFYAPDGNFRHDLLHALLIGGYYKMTPEEMNKLYPKGDNLLISGANGLEHIKADPGAGDTNAEEENNP